MRAAAVLLLSMVLAVSALGQIRVERDRNGNIVASNKDSVEETSGSSASIESAGLKVTSAQRRKIEAKLREACERKGLDFKVVSALVEAESSYQPHTLSHKGAIGLMQLIPETAERFGVKDPWNMDQNIEGGTSYLKWLKEEFSGNLPLVLAGYNAGENAVKKYKGRIPPYSETVHYVFKILHKVGNAELIGRAKTLLTNPGDYERYYLAKRGRKVHTRVYYMFIDEKGHRHFTDSPPNGAKVIPIVYKDD
jgi:soluble lytic murein transglycosylase-like protein